MFARALPSSSPVTSKAPRIRPTLGVVALRFTLMIVSVVLALGFAEGAMRMLPAPPRLQEDAGTPDDALWVDPDWRSPPPKAYRMDPILGYDNAPSARADVRVAEHPGRAFRFRTESYGIRRDTDVTIPKPPDVHRVLVLGDSQTSGYANNDETYPGRLEEAWQARSPGQTVEVLNAGVDGYGPQQAYLWYRERAAPLDPDLVIFAIYVGNDLSDLAFGDVDGAIIDDEAGRVSPFLTPWTWAQLHSELVKRIEPPLALRLHDPLERFGVQVGPPVPPAGTEPLIRVMKECHGCWFQSLRQATRAQSHPDQIGRSYDRLETLLRLLHSRVTANGTTLAVLLIPTKNQVEPNDERGAVARAARLLDLDDSVLSYDERAYAGLREVAQRAGVSVIDPLDDLRADASGTRLYYRRDWHLNPDGNRALAAAIDRALSAMGAAPGAPTANRVH